MRELVKCWIRGREWQPRVYPAVAIVLLLLSSMWPQVAQAQWEEVTDIPAFFRNTQWLDVFFLDDAANLGWICGRNGHVLRTVDGGQSWLGSIVQDDNAGVNGGQLESIQFLNPTVGYASGPNGIFKSEDGGVTWRFLRLTPAISVWGCYFLDENYGLVIGAGCNSDGRKYFFRTTDGGDNWSFFSTTLGGRSSLSDLILYPDTGLGYAASSGLVWQTLDSGRTWRIFSVSGPADWQEEITHINQSFLVPVSNGCSGGLNDGGMRFTVDNGSNWRATSVGAPMFGADLIDDTTGWVCGHNAGIYFTSDGGQTWELRNCGIRPNAQLDDLWIITDSTAWLVGEGVYRQIGTEFPERPTIVVDGPAVLCPGDSLTLTIEEGTFVRWSTGETTRSITVRDAGTYYVDVQIATNCSVTSLPVSIDIGRPTPEIAAIGGSTTICDGETVTLEAPAGFVSYTWSTGETTQSISVDQSGEYFVTVLDTLGCTGESNRLTVVVRPLPQPVIVPEDILVCPDEMITLQAPAGFVSYRWSNGAPTHEITVQGPGVYTVTVVDEFGCEGVSAERHIRLRPEANVLQLVSDLEDGQFSLGTIAPFALQCRELTFRNVTTDASIELNSLFLMRNIEFSLPQAQFPLELGPGETQSITVCYSPLIIGVQRDTILLDNYCLPSIPLVAEGGVNHYNGTYRCNTDVQLTTIDLDGFPLWVSQPYPNPASNHVLINVESFRPLEEATLPQHCYLRDALGRTVATGYYDMLERRERGDRVQEAGVFIMPVEDLPQGVYYAMVYTYGNMLTYQIVVRH